MSNNLFWNNQFKFSLLSVLKFAWEKMVHYNKCRKPIWKSMAYTSGRNESLKIKLYLFWRFFLNHQALNIWCSIFVVFRSLYKLIKIWSHAWYFPIQIVSVNILFISMLGFLRRGRKNILKAEEFSGLEGEQWLANIFHFNSCSRSLTSLCIFFFISIHLLFRQLPEYMFIAHRRENSPSKMWH